jgi:hypothetical protein
VPLWAVAAFLVKSISGLNTNSSLTFFSVLKIIGYCHITADIDLIVDANNYCEAKWKKGGK